MPLATGEKLGAYEIVSLLGKGGIGEVWKARDPRLGRDVAIKVSAQQFTDRFEREARAIAALNHTNICTLYDVGPNYLVMELIEGPTLADRIKEGPIPLKEALGIAKQIAAALEAAHDKNIVHRDLKPANVKIKPDGSVKVLDFGLAKSAEHAEVSADSPTMMSATQIGMILGTAGYMAPEQARGKKDLDKRADIWAFGVVLYEMLTAKRLFQGEDVTHTLASVILQEPDLSAAPPEVQPLLKRCLEKDPKNRLRDIGDWELLLANTPAPAIQEVHAASAASRLPWIAAAAVFAITTAALAFIHFRETPEPHPLTRFSVDLGPDAAHAPRITAAISPNGRRLAFIARAADGNEQLATRLLDQANATVLAGTEGAADPFFSPDSQWIGFFADGKMKKISVQGGAAVTLCDAPNDRGANWGEDGTIIVSLDSVSGTGLSRVPDSGGTPQALTRPGDTGDASHRWPQILPGRQAVLFSGSSTVADWDNAAIYALSLKTGNGGKVKVVERGGYFARYLPTSSRSGTLVYIHQGTLFGVPFDPERLEARGTPAPLLEDVAGDPVSGGGQFDFSRNGTFVYLKGKSGGGSMPLVWLASTGKMEPLLATPGLYFAPRLSPDGKLLAFSAGIRDIEVYDGARDRTTRLTFTSQAANTSPVWTPDGKHIVFRSQSGPGSSLQWVRADGAGGAQRLMESKTDLQPYSFSPDGKRLAFGQVSRQTGFDIWTLPLNVAVDDPEHPKPGQPELFLSAPADEAEPVFSPDGRWIAYRTNVSGRAEVYVQPFPGTPGGAGGKWLIGAGRHPVWSRNGREIFYFNPATSHIMVATYAAKGDAFSADKSRVWSDTQILEANASLWNFDLTPDGKRVVASPKPEAAAQKASVHVTVLENFFDELRRKMPAAK